MARKPKSWWGLKKVRHRDAVILATLSSACLLAGNVATPQIQSVYVDLISAANQPLLFIFIATLSVLAYLTYFAGILVLVGGVNFMWGYVNRGRFLLGLGVGLSFLGLARQFAFYWLTTGTPFAYWTFLTTGLVGPGLLVGFASYSLMGEYALMLKKHAKHAWRRWSRTRRQVALRTSRRNGRLSGRPPNGRSSSRRSTRS